MLCIWFVILVECFCFRCFWFFYDVLKLLIWAKYNISYLLILNWLYGTTSEQLVIPNPEKKTGSHASFFLCNLLVKDYIKICESDPGNWDSICCFVSTDVSRFDNLFFFNYIIDFYGKPHKSRFDVSVPAHSTATTLHC